MLGMSRTTIYEKLKSRSRYFDPSFPRPVKLSSLAQGMVGWRASEVSAWIKSL